MAEHDEENPGSGRTNPESQESTVHKRASEAFLGERVNDTRSWGRTTSVNQVTGHTQELKDAAGRYQEATQNHAPELALANQLEQLSKVHTESGLATQAAYLRDLNTGMRLLSGKVNMGEVPVLPGDPLEGNASQVLRMEELMRQIRASLAPLEPSETDALRKPMADIARHARESGLNQAIKEIGSPSFGARH